MEVEDNQLAVFGAGLGGGHLEAAALSGAIAENDAVSLRKALRAAEDVLDAEHLQERESNEEHVIIYILPIRR